jgi:hypothetical protein
MRYIILGVGALIAFEGFKAYGALGQEWNGILGKVLAILVFVIIQWGELKPVVMTKGQMGPLQIIAQSFGGKQIDLQLTDPEELHAACLWAFRCFIADMVVGLVVWMPIKAADPMQLIQAGAVTLADLSWSNLGMILAVTFLLEECVAFYLRKGGTIPAIGRKKGDVADQGNPQPAQPKQAKTRKTNARWGGRRTRNANK